jgi:hypothetical protein
LHIALKLTVKERSDQMARWVDLVEREANDGSTPGRHVRFHDRGHLFYSARGPAMLGYIAITILDCPGWKSASQR